MGRAGEVLSLEGSCLCRPGHGIKGQSSAVPIAAPPGWGGDWSISAHRVRSYGSGRHKTHLIRRRIATPRDGDGLGYSGWTSVAKPPNGTLPCLRNLILGFRRLRRRRPIIHSPRCNPLGALGTESRGAAPPCPSPPRPGGVAIGRGLRTALSPTDSTAIKRRRPDVGSPPCGPAMGSAPRGTAERPQAAPRPFTASARLTPWAPPLRLSPTDRVGPVPSPL